LYGHSNEITALAELANNDLVSASDDFTINIWENGTFLLKKSLAKHTGGITCVCVLLSGDLASASRDKNIIVWNIKTLAPFRTLNGHTGTVCKSRSFFIIKYIYMHRLNNFFN